MFSGTTATARVFTFKLFSFPSSFPFPTKARMESSPRHLHQTLMTHASCSSPRRGKTKESSGFGPITLQEWQGWGTMSQVPSKVVKVIEDLKLLERNLDAQMCFGGSGGKLQGDFKIEEDKKHRATYDALGDSEKKLQFFSARQIACRLLGSRGYLCQKCWLPLEGDCMCLKLNPCSLWHGIHFWLYMHPKDFLRQNNTGKLLWQVFGVESATLCLFGISEQEEIMWKTLKHAGKNKVWCLYPNKNAVTNSVQDAFGQGFSAVPERNSSETNEDEALHFILIDGTWSNSAAMFRRLKDQSRSIWAEEDLHCISLATGASTMHRLRPQPSWDRTCTAAAAIGLLSELHALPQFSSLGLDKQAEALEDALVVLLEALTSRRLRMGRSITRKVRHHSNVC